MHLTADWLTESLAGVALCLLSITVHADNLPPLNKLHHLSPLDKSGIELYQDFSKYTRNIAPTSDYRESAIYVDAGDGFGDFIGIYQKKDPVSYYLLYVSIPTGAVTKVILPPKFAGEVIEKLQNIIVVGTRYSTEAIPLIGCLGAKNYLFESMDDLYGTVIDCVATDSALHLVHVADGLIDLAKFKSPSKDEQDKKITDILSELDLANQQATRGSP